MPKPKKEKKEAEYTCPYCRNKVPASQSEKVGNRYYHKDCYEKKQKEDEEKQRHSNDYKELIDYICNLYGLQAPTGMILKQIKDYQNEYGFKLKGMELALRYFHETLDNPVREDVGIGIVIYTYEEAKRHYIKKKKIERSVQDLEVNRQETKVVSVKSPKFEIRKKVKSIDISVL